MMNQRHEIVADWSPSSTRMRCDEEPGYLNQGNEQIYYVHHPAGGVKCGAVLIAGPFANERTCSAITMRRWARFIAEKGFEVVRFDYRGVGESTGKFHQMTFSSWRKDICLCYEMIEEKAGDLPIFLHGFRLGALLLSQEFKAGRGSALLMWEPPIAGITMLKSMLRSRLTMDMVTNPAAKRKTRKEYFSEIEAGELVDVDGFHWSGSLLSDAKNHQLVLPDESETRPWRVVHLEKKAKVVAPGNSEIIKVPTPSFWKMSPLLKPDLSELFNYSVQWMIASVSRHKSEL